MCKYQLHLLRRFFRTDHNMEKIVDSSAQSHRRGKVNNNVYIDVRKVISVDNVVVVVVMVRYGIDWYRY